MALPDGTISEVFSSLGARLRALEAGGSIGLQRLAPGILWSGTAGSGYDGSPPVQTGTPIACQPEAGNMYGTLAPNAHWLNLATSDTMITGEQIVMIDASAPSVSGVAGGIEYVDFYCEGNVVRVTEQTAEDLPAWQRTRKAGVYAVMLPDTIPVGGMDLYARIQPTNPAYVERVIGPMRVYKKSGYDRIIDIAPSQGATAGVRYPSVQSALAYLATAWVSGEHIRLRCVEDVVIDPTTTAFTTSIAATAGKRGQVHVDSNGHDVLCQRASGFGQWRSLFNNLVFKGVRVDIARIAQLPMEPGTGTSAGYRAAVFEDSEIFSSNGWAELPGNDGQGEGVGKAARVLSPFNYPIVFSRCHIHDLSPGYAGMTLFKEVGCRIERLSGDAGHMDSRVGVLNAYNSFDEITGAPYRDYRTAIIWGAYTGSGTPGWDTINPAGNGASTTRALVLKVDGAEVTRIVATSTPGTGAFDPADLAAAINAYGNGFSASLAPNADANTIRAAFIGVAGRTGQLSVPATPTIDTINGRPNGLNLPLTVPISVAIDIHADLTQYSANPGQIHENHRIVGNYATNGLVQFHFAFLTASNNTATYNCAFLNNACENDATDSETPIVFSQIESMHYGMVIAGNSLPNQGITFRRAAAFVLDGNSRIMANVFRNMGQDNALGTLEAMIKDNAVMEANPTNPPTGANVSNNPVVGTALASYPQINVKPFTETGFVAALGSAVRGFAVTRQIPYDITGSARPAVAPAGAIA